MTHTEVMRPAGVGEGVDRARVDMGKREGLELYFGARINGAKDGSSCGDGQGRGDPSPLALGQK